MIRVVVIEDSLPMMEFVATCLAEMPEVEVAGSAVDGSAGLELVGALAPHLVICDCQMPRMSGFEFTRRLRQNFPHTQVILMSISDDQAAQGRALDCGASSFICKSRIVELLPAEVKRLFPPAPPASV